MSAPTVRAGRLVGTGLVRLLDPTPGKPYFRVLYDDPQGRRGTSVGRDPDAALARAEALDAELARDPADLTCRTLGSLVAEYTSTGQGRRRNTDGYLTGKDWEESYRKMVARALRTRPPASDPRSDAISPGKRTGTLPWNITAAARADADHGHTRRRGRHGRPAESPVGLGRRRRRLPGCRRRRVAALELAHLPVGTQPHRRLGSWASVGGFGQTAAGN